MRVLAFTVLVAFAACGRPVRGGNGDDQSAADDDGRDDAGIGDGGSSDDDASPSDAGNDTDMPNDAFPSVVDLRIDCHNTCVLTANPARIDVPTGTSFTVNWINVGDTECDVAKIDSSPNDVPIILGLEPGTSYHDTIRNWCGSLFTGTFDFEIRICEIPSYIPVDCSATP